MRASIFLLSSGGIAKSVVKMLLRLALGSSPRSEIPADRLGYVRATVTAPIALWVEFFRSLDRQQPRSQTSSRQHYSGDRDRADDRDRSEFESIRACVSTNGCGILPKSKFIE